MTLRIGDLSLQSNMLLSPLEGVSDVGFRSLCYRNGAGMTWTEMVRASGIVRRNKATLDLIDTYDKETLTGVQLFIVNERELAAALHELESLATTTQRLQNIHAIDLNFGCPSPEVIRLGAGPALLKRTAKMEQICKTLYDWKQKTGLDIGAIGIKIRLGLNALERQHCVYLRIMDTVNANLDYITIHARHAQQRSNTPADWRAIQEVKAMATVKVIGNGDVFDLASAKRMMAETGCDGIMIARAAIRNPWIFRELTGRGSSTPTPEEIVAAAETYERYAKQYGTKEKYQRFHEENFARIKRGSVCIVPKNCNLR